MLHAYPKQARPMHVLRMQDAVRSRSVQLQSKLMLMFHTRSPTRGTSVYKTIDSIVKGLETDLINTFPVDSPLCTVDNIVDSFHGCF